VASFREKFGHRLQRSVARFGVSALRLSGAYSGYWDRWRADDLFSYAEAHGLHILPVHYYTPIPTAIDTARPRRPNKMTGVGIDVQAGAGRANKLIEKYRSGIDKLLSGSEGYDPKNSGFHPLDAAVLYATIREVKPKRIIEIGSGMSTLAMISAIRDTGQPIELSCIEPYLPDYLKPRKPEIKAVMERQLQEVPLDIFSELEAGDILFIDSTHVVRYDSDVVYEILEILPLLKPGVIVHVHDIFFPNDYPEQWLKEHRFFWAEQYMLQAFLSMNPNFQIEIPLHAAKNLMTLQGVLSAETDVQVTSLWMRRI
jgi:predicted O-methyltransferase YrrM